MTREEFSILVQQLGRKLYDYAFRILRNREESEDVVQEIFIKLWNMRKKLDDYRSIDALAITMTRNQCIDTIRKSKNEYKGDLDYYSFGNMTVPSPHENMEIRESDMIIKGIIDKMPENIRTVMKQHDIDGKSYEEIAESTGHNINTLRVNISRARKFVRDEFNKYHNGQ
jgi:RNA polymerase sigma-70 factor (family 1)